MHGPYLITTDSSESDDEFNYSPGLGAVVFVILLICSGFRLCCQVISKVPSRSAVVTTPTATTVQPTTTTRVTAKGNSMSMRKKEPLQLVQPPLPAYSDQPIRANTAASNANEYPLKPVKLDLDAPPPYPMTYPYPANTSM